MEITREQFAHWSFEEDKANGLYEDNGPGWPAVDSWDELPEDEKTLYLEEADFEMSQPQEDWPLCILEQLEKKGQAQNAQA